MLGRIVRATSLKLNTVNDPFPGTSVVGPTGISPYIGQLGMAVELGPDQVKYDPTVGTLFGGMYVYVRTQPGSTASPARGKLAFWLAPTVTYPENSFTVSADAQPTAAIPTLVAGVFLNAITPGNYGFIQVSGRASVLFDSAVTAAAAGNWVTAKVSAAVASTADVGAVAGVVTIGSMIGVAEALPVISTISVVQLSSLYKRI